MPFERDPGLVGENPHDHPAIEKNNQAGYKQVHQAFLEPGEGDGQAPQPKHPAARAYMDRWAPHQPDHKPTHDDDQQAGLTIEALAANQREAAEDHKPYGVIRKVKPIAVDKGRGEDKWKTEQLSRVYAKRSQDAASDFVGQLHQKHNQKYLANQHQSIAGEKPFHRVFASPIKPCRNAKRSPQDSTSRAKNIGLPGA
jgi:hypothetical protein